MLLRENNSFLEKNSFTKGFFQGSKNRVRERNVYKMKVVIQNSAIKGRHEFHLKTHKDLEMLILSTSFLLLTRLTL